MLYRRMKGCLLFYSLDDVSHFFFIQAWHCQSMGGVGNWAVKKE